MSLTSRSGGLCDFRVEQRRRLAAGALSGTRSGRRWGDTLVDPDNGCNIVQEYVFLAMEMTENCGRSDGTVRSVRDTDPGDPNARFIAPFEADSVIRDHWIAT